MREVLSIIFNRIADNRKENKCKSHNVEQSLKLPLRRHISHQKIIDDIFDISYKRKYRGYIGGGVYTRYGGTLDPNTFKQRQDYYGTGGSVRNGSTGNSNVRGGGPGVGK